MFIFFCYCYGVLHDLHSFPTRRSSDLLQRSHQRKDRVQDLRPSHAIVSSSLYGTPCRSVRSPAWSMYQLSRTAPCRSEEHTSELQSRLHLVCRLLLEKKNRGRERRATL